MKNGANASAAPAPQANINPILGQPVNDDNEIIQRMGRDIS